MSNFNEAIEISLRTWYPKDHPLHLNPHHPLGKLLGEWGELLDDYMKSLYKPGYIFKPEDELGDIWYYLRILAYQTGCELNQFDMENQSLDKLFALVIHEVSMMLYAYCIGIDGHYNELSYPYSLMLEIARRYNLNLDDLTASNWEKLKPGSKRGEEWMQARVSTDYVGGKVAKI
jgi:hypothetical protein